MVTVLWFYALINKSGKGRGYFEGWGVPEVAQVQKAPTKIWPRLRIYNSRNKSWVRDGGKTHEEFFSQMFLENQDCYPNVPKPSPYHDPIWTKSTDLVVEDLHALFGRGKAKDPKEEPPKPPLDYEMALKYAEEAGIDKVDVVIDKKTGVVEEPYGDKVIKQPGLWRTTHQFQYLRTQFSSNHQEERPRRTESRAPNICLKKWYYY